MIKDTDWKYDGVGTALAVCGSILSLSGALVNNLFLMHTMAMWFWQASNPILFLWAYGTYKKWWDGGISIEAIGIMYFVFSITNAYGLWFK